MPRGGKRPGAGRPRKPTRRERIDRYVATGLADPYAPMQWKAAMTGALRYLNRCPDDREFEELVFRWVLRAGF